MKIILPIAALVLSACNVSEKDKVVEDCNVVPALNPTNARADARSAWRNKDWELLAVRGYVEEIPGAENSSLPFRVLDGTSDDQCLEINQRVREYAEIYNLELLRLQGRK